MRVFSLDIRDYQFNKVIIFRYFYYQVTKMPNQPINLVTDDVQPGIFSCKEQEYNKKETFFLEISDKEKVYKSTYKKKDTLFLIELF